MTGLLGEVVLVAALVAAIGAFGAAMGAWGRGSARWLRLSGSMLGVGAAAMSCAVGLLAWALARGDMTLAYVAGHTERALPLGYRLAALWAGQEGSLLLWAWMTAMVAAFAAAAGARRLPRPDADGETNAPRDALRSAALQLATLGAVNLFFAALLLSVADPFVRSVGGPAPLGMGLNPLLQHWAMVLHPPLLFAGYAFSVVAFAAMIGALGAGDVAEGWSSGVRRWALASWLFLSGGIALGAWWAYVELGWGGYWAWDPVENASLLPWLTGTALLHTLAIDRQRGQFRGWTASLSAATFVLCLVATYITRSGVIESVHAFGRSGVGTFFLAAIAASGGASAGLIVWRRRALRSGIGVESLFSREGVFLMGNVLLTVMAGVVLLGTLSPVISGVLGSEPVAVNASFYNRIVAPLGLALAGLMALGPVLTYGQRGERVLRRDLAWPVGVTAGLVALGAALGVRSIAALACIAIAGMTTMLIAISLRRAVLASMRAHGLAWWRAAARVLDTDHRRYGGQLAHLGLVLVIVGVAGSGLYATRQSLSLRRGEAALVGGYAVRLEGLREVRGPNYSAVEATLVATRPGGRTVELRPQRRYYDMSVESYAEVAIRSRLREDLYVALLGWESGGDVAAVQVLINPLTAWIWIGAAAVCAGGTFALLPRLGPAPGRVPARAADTNESIIGTRRRGRDLAGEIRAAAR